MSYLNEMPVSDDDRRAAEAWAKGSYEAERAERQLIREERKIEHRQNL